MYGMCEVAVGVNWTGWGCHSLVLNNASFPSAGIIQIRCNKGLTHYGGALSPATPSSPSKVFIIDYNVLGLGLYIYRVSVGAGHFFASIVGMVRGDREERDKVNPLIPTNSVGRG